MSKILEQIKADSIKARRDMGRKGKFLSFVISEIQKVEKIVGGPATDDEVITVLKKLATKTEDLIQYGDEAVKEELKILRSYMPEMISEKQIVDVIKREVQAGNEHIGKLMGKIKSEFGSVVDMKQAKTLVEKIIKS